MAAEKTRAVAYCRVSTPSQANEGVSLEAQRAKLDAYAALYGIDIVAVEIDAGLSACTLDRPGLQRALAAMRAGAADAILVVKLDRLTRSVRDLCDLVDRYFAAGKWALLSVGEQIDTRSAAGRLVMNVLASVSQWEREATGERTSAALQHKAAIGEYTGGRVPFGFKLGPDGVLLARDATETEIREIARAHRQGGMSLRQIAVDLFDRGCRSRTGKRFDAKQIARMVA